MSAAVRGCPVACLPGVAQFAPQAPEVGSITLDMERSGRRSAPSASSPQPATVELWRRGMTFGSALSLALAGMPQAFPVAQIGLAFIGASLAALAQPGGCITSVMEPCVAALAR